jgi:phosphate transport system substrate-binding protein
VESSGGNLRSAAFTSGKYEVVARLGRGGMAQVFLAVVRGLGGFNKLLVIKRLESSDPSFRRMFLDEARVAAMLSHPNVVHTYEVSEHGGSYFIAMEYLDGQPLNKIIRRAQELGNFLNPRLCARVVADALSGLHCAHELRDYGGAFLNVVHRDVSPHNLFVTHDGQVKIFDFGVAKAESRLEDTESGVLKGKLGYMSPEQAAGDAVDRRADVFSVGVVLWELLTLRQLVTRESNIAALRQALHGSVPDLPTSLPDVDAELRGIVKKALERDKAQRFQSAHEMRVALLSYLERQPFAQEDLARFMHEQFQSARADLQQRIQDTIFPTGGADPVISVSETARGDDPLLFGAADDLLPVLESVSFNLALPDQTQAITPPAPNASAPSTPPVGLGQFERLPARRSLRGPAALAAFLFAASLGGWLLLRPSGSSRSTAAGTLAAAVPREPAESAPLLRIHGSNTMGSELLPALAEAYLRSRGLLGVQRWAGPSPEEIWVGAGLDGKSKAERIEIRAEGSSTAFSDLASHACDIGMSSRAIKPVEVEDLLHRGLGDLQSPAAEHVIGLDGISVIVHPNNPLVSLDLEQLRRIFSGRAAEFPGAAEQLGGVHVVARDDRSGTYDTFQRLVLGDEPLARASKRWLDSGALSEAVASDPQAIGFIGLAYVRGAKAVAVAEAGAMPLYASPFTVGTEDYALSRRLYLYVPAQSASASALAFVNFALSVQGQSLVRSSGFVDLDVRSLEPRSCDGRCSPRYASLTRGAKRLSLDFRFRAGGVELDSRGLKDIDRLLDFLRQVPDPRLMLLGFSDAQGTVAQNLAVSRERAQKVADELAARGIHESLIEALGQEMPNSSNASEAGRERNRRVEVWLR